jgi:signal peptidase I
LDADGSRRQTPGGAPTGGRGQELREWLVAGFIGIILAVTAGTALRAFVLGAVAVPSRSMCDTVVPGDMVLVSKLVVPRTVAIPLPFTEAPCTFTLPPLRRIRIGDVLVARPPAEVVARAGERTAYVVKRCAGLPGDTLIFNRASLLVNGLHYRLPQHAAQVLAPRVYLGNGACDTLVVPDDAYFLLGDNPGESVDSRVWGPVPASSIVGVAAMIYWSLDPGDRGERGAGIRWDRIGK